MKNETTENNDKEKSLYIYSPYNSKDKMGSNDIEA